MQATISFFTRKQVEDESYIASLKQTLQAAVEENTQLHQQMNEVENLVHAYDESQSYLTEMSILLKVSVDDWLIRIMRMVQY